MHSPTRTPMTARQGHPDPDVFLIAERFGESGGGEAIKAYQYACHLYAAGRGVMVFTHARSLRQMGAAGFNGQIHTVADGPVQRLLWRSRVLSPLLQPYFHLKARGLIRRELQNHPDAILHYISPVSPVAPRFAPRGHAAVFGPMTGNIYYPPGFRDRMSLHDRLRARFHDVAQRLLGWLFQEKRRARCLLVSGYERTRASLALAGCRPEQMLDVVDSGVSDGLVQRPRLMHCGANARFVLSGRMVDHKGMDLAIKALPKCREPVTLDLFGDGPERTRLETLARSLGVQDRVAFRGWVASHDALVAAFSDYRGYVFPSLAEANGIVMQEAMMIGLPVIALRWGGPAHLAPDDAAAFIAPNNEDQICREIAAALDRLAADGDQADALAARARDIAAARFTWEAVAKSWEAAYRSSWQSGYKEQQSKPAGIKECVPAFLNTVGHD